MIISSELPLVMMNQTMNLYFATIQRLQEEVVVATLCSIVLCAIV